MSESSSNAVCGEQVKLGWLPREVVEATSVNLTRYLTRLV